MKYKKADQVLCDVNGMIRGDWRLMGGCECPFCGKRNETVIPADIPSSKPAMVVLHPTKRCEHADMAVSAGDLDIAIQFYLK